MRRTWVDAMAAAAGKKEPKNPARVDAALKTHLRRMDAEVRSRTILVVAGIVTFMLLVTFRPMRPGRTGVCASVSLVASLMAAVGLVAALDTRRRTRGKLLRTCRGCGYDLRATADVCPECGTPIPEELRRAREMGKDKLYMGETAATKE